MGAWEKPGGTSMTNEKLLLEDEKLSEGISRLFEYEGDTPIGSLTDEVTAIFNTAENLEKYAETTVASLVKDIYNLSQATFNEPIELADFQNILYMDVENLADKLGIELD